MVDLLVVAVAGACIGALVAWLISRARIVALLKTGSDREWEMDLGRAAFRDLEARHGRTVQELSALHSERTSLVADRARLTAELEAERRFTAEKVSTLEQAEWRLREAFSAACHQALETNNQAFLHLAQTRFAELEKSAKNDLSSKHQSIEELVRPMHAGLERLDATVQKLDVDRVETHAAIREQLHAMAATGDRLSSQTNTLVRALKTPNVRGQWGEMQLRRAAELAGMLEHCDFETQQTVEGDEGRLRPDLLVHMPGRKLVVVDAKVPLDAYMDAQAADDEAVRETLLDRHARQVRDHITRLASKEYSNAFTETPDFVVMFLPGESFFSEACRRDPALVDYAISNGVMPASPITLITLLKAVAFGWQQERLAANAEQLRDLGLELYDRVRVLAEHFAGVRRGLEAAVSAYNSAVGTLEGRFLPTARKFRELGVSTKREIIALSSVDTTPRVPSANELVA